MEPSALLSRWLSNRLSKDAGEWLDGQRAKLSEGYTDRTLHITLGLVPRRLGKDDLAPGEAELTAAREARAHWDPHLWSVADAARVLVLLETAEHGNQPFPDRFVDLCRTSDVAELIAYYRGLPLYPEPEALEPQAGEGLRTNMASVFEAVAHRNPYPRERFSEARWNQMVLKALFVGSRLDPIQGLDERANPELAQIMCDYAHERWSAGRAVAPELWRCVGPFASDGMVDDLARAYASEVPAEALAGGLALMACPDARAPGILGSRPDLEERLRAGGIDWHAIAEMSR